MVEDAGAVAAAAAEDSSLLAPAAREVRVVALPARRAEAAEVELLGDVALRAATPRWQVPPRLAAHGVFAGQRGRILSYGQKGERVVFAIQPWNGRFISTGSEGQKRSLSYRAWTT